MSMAESNSEGIQVEDRARELLEKKYMDARRALELTERIQRGETIEDREAVEEAHYMMNVVFAEEIDRKEKAKAAGIKIPVEVDMNRAKRGVDEVTGLEIVYYHDPGLSDEKNEENRIRAVEKAKEKESYFRELQGIRGGGKSEQERWHQKAGEVGVKAMESIRLLAVKNPYVEQIDLAEQKQFDGALTTRLRYVYDHLDYLHEAVVAGTKKLDVTEKGKIAGVQVDDDEVNLHVDKVLNKATELRIRKFELQQESLQRRIAEAVARSEPVDDIQGKLEEVQEQLVKLRA